MIAYWIIFLVCCTLMFTMVRKRQRNGKNVSLTIKVAAAILSCHINLIGTALLYEPVMAFFEISTYGFMNFNGWVTATVIWIFIAVIVLIVSYYAKVQLGTLYRPVRVVQKLSLILPIIFFTLFLFLVSLK
ncbi:hypothetical protein [Niabella terrae]